jgi:predicted O-methyltransferase YrrM
MLIRILARFAPEGVVEKAHAAHFALLKLCAFPSRLRAALARGKAERILFHSGFGDSAELLYGLVRSMKPEVCVEIGSARGKSACYIGMALKENGRGTLYAIDPHLPTDWNDSFSVDTAEVFARNVAEVGVTGQVCMIRSYSGTAATDWNRPIDFLLIDGDHSYEGIKRDWDLFVPHLRRFGVVAFHDTIWNLNSAPQVGQREDMGVPRFVDELRQQGYPVITIERDCGLSIVQPFVGGISLCEQSPAV